MDKQNEPAGSQMAGQQQAQTVPQGTPDVSKPSEVASPPARDADHLTPFAPTAKGAGVAQEGSLPAPETGDRREETALKEPTRGRP